MLLLITAVHQIGTGLVLALVPMRLAIEGFPAWVAGAMSTSFSLGFLAGCLAAAPLIALLQSRTAMIAFILFNGGSTILLWLFPDPLAWCISRLLGGFVTAGVWVIIEAWLGARTKAANRGVVYGTYMLLSRLSFTLAQVGLTWVDPRIGALFLLATGAYALAWLPILAIDGPAPAIDRKAPPRILNAMRHAPAASVGSLVHGLVTTVGPALLPIYGTHQGLNTGQIALGLAAIQFGGLLLQLPLAMASDRWGRRSIMALCALGTAVLSFAALYVPPQAFAAFLVILIAWGGAPAVIYSLAISHANDRAQDHERLALSSSLLMLWGAGSALGPLCASVLMDGFGDGAMFVFTGVLGAALVVFLGWRKYVRKPAKVRGPLPGATPPA